MSSGRLGLCFGIHHHQPIGNFERVLLSWPLDDAETDCAVTLTVRSR